jgi:hypothetical protein
LDNRISEMVRSASHDKPSMVEARIGGATVAHTLQLMKEGGTFRGDIRICRILITANEPQRIERLLKEAATKGRPSTYEKELADTRDRQQKDLKRFREMYPWLGRQNPLSRFARDAEGRLIYNTVIDNTYYSQEQTLEDVMEQLKDLGFLSRNVGISQN